MTLNRVFIFTGGQIDPLVLKEVKSDDILIGADRGAQFLVEHGVSPDYAVGDFDSVTPEELEAIRRCSKQLITCDPVDKDLTDTELAYDLAIEKQASEVILVGALGSRIDHSLANIQMMLRGLQHQMHTMIWDHNNLITLTGSGCTIEDRGFTYVSLLPLTTEVTGIHLTGFMYPLTGATLKMGQSLGISNRLIEPQGRVTIESGLLLIIQSKD